MSLWTVDCFAEVCENPYYYEFCGDNNLGNCFAQNGTGYGYTFFGTRTSPISEGQRLVNCETNGQAGAIFASDIAWANVTCGSFTTSTPAGTLPLENPLPLVSLVNCAAWRFTGVDLAVSFLKGTAFLSDNNCTSVQISNCFIAQSKVGIDLGGRWHTVSGCSFGPNANDSTQGKDILIRSRYTTVTGNTCNSAQLVNIAEASPAGYNNFVGNICAGPVGLTLVAGNQSVQTSNILGHPNS